MLPAHQPPHPHQREIRELTGLRGVLALWVVLGHCAATLPLNLHPLAQDLWNVRAVDAFICLSGFVIALALHRKREGIGGFLIKRLLRLYPVYGSVLAVSALATKFTATALSLPPHSAKNLSRLDLIAAAQQHLWPDLPAHIAMLHGLLPLSIAPLAAYTFVGQAWSISLEWQFYLVAPFLAWALRRKHAVSIAIAAGFAVLLMAVGRWMNPAFLGNHLPAFALGALSYGAWQQQAVLARMPWLQPIVIAGLAMATLRHGMAMAGLDIWCLTMLALLYRSQYGVAWCALLRARSLRALGLVSYSLYLSHFLVLIACLRATQMLGIWQGWTPRAASALLLAVTLPACCVVAWLVHRLIENPGNRLGQVLARRKPAPPPIDALANQAF